MAAGGNPLFEVVAPGPIREQMRVLGQRAAALGMLPLYVDTWRTIVARLERQPSTWGDPIYNLHDLGVRVYHHIEGPLYLTYAVDVVNRLVLIRSFSPLPGHPLGSGDGGGGPDS